MTNRNATSWTNPKLCPWANAICYSGYRQGQSPQTHTYPSYAEVKEDLILLAQHWRYLRLYDCSPHAQLVIDVITREKLELKLLLGANLAAEVSNPDCPWGADYSDAQLAENIAANQAEIEKLIELANRHSNLVLGVSIGNEASVDWNDHMVPVPSLIAHTRRIKQAIDVPVTFCENYVPWSDKLIPLAEELDFISLHTYPVWEYKSVDEALAYTQANYGSVAKRFPNKPVIITEAGWTTGSNGRGIEPDNASQGLQTTYLKQLMTWVREEQILTFLFEAFDEPWKGSDDPLEPEKHWGLYDVHRQPKQYLSNEDLQAAHWLPTLQSA